MGPPPPFNLCPAVYSQAGTSILCLLAEKKCFVGTQQVSTPRERKKKKRETIYVIDEPIQPEVLHLNSNHENIVVMNLAW